MKKIFIICILLQIPMLGLFALDIPSDILVTLKNYIGKNVSDLPPDSLKAGNTEYVYIIQQTANPFSVVGMGFSVKDNRIVQAVYQFMSLNEQEIDDIQAMLVKIMEPYGQSQREGGVLYWHIEKGFIVVISRQKAQGAYAVSIRMSETSNNPNQ